MSSEHLGSQALRSTVPQGDRGLLVGGGRSHLGQPNSGWPEVVDSKSVRGPQPGSEELLLGHRATALRLAAAGTATFTQRSRDGTARAAHWGMPRSGCTSSSPSAIQPQAGSSQEGCSWSKGLGWGTIPTRGSSAGDAEGCVSRGLRSRAGRGRERFTHLQMGSLGKQPHGKAAGHLKGPVKRATRRLPPSGGPPALSLGLVCPRKDPEELQAAPPPSPRSSTASTASGLAASPGQAASAVVFQAQCMYF